MLRCWIAGPCNAPPAETPRLLIRAGEIATLDANVARLEAEVEALKEGKLCAELRVPS